MQTYTHLAMGTALGLGLCPDQPLAIAALMVGSIAPDLSMVPAFMWDKLHGRQPLAVQTAMTMFLKNIGHNVAIWGMAVAAGTLMPASIFAIFLAFGLGGMIHILLDMFSHNDPKFRETEAKYLWPITNEHIGIGSWDYRRGAGILWPPKWPEELVLIVSVLVTAFLVLN